MNEGTDIIIAAILSPALTLFISEFFRYRYTKVERKERFFYELFPKRLELYEEIIEAMEFVDNTEEALRLDSAITLSDYYKEKCDALTTLGFRCAVMGSNRVARTLALLVEAVAEFSKIISSVYEPGNTLAYRNLVNSFTPSAVSIKIKLIQFIREESGAHIVDNKAADFLREIEKQKNIKKKQTKQKNVVPD